MIKVGGIEGDVLKQYISKIERLEQEKIEIQDHIRETYADAIWWSPLSRQFFK